MPINNATQNTPAMQLPKGSFNYHDYLGFVTDPDRQEKIGARVRSAVDAEATRRRNVNEDPMTMAERHAIIQDITHKEYRSAIVGMLSSSENQALIKAIDEAEKSAHTMEPKDLLYFAMAGRQLAYFLEIVGGSPLPATLTTGTPKNEDYAAFYAEKLGAIPKAKIEKPETFTAELLRNNIPNANPNAAAATRWRLYLFLGDLDALRALAKAMGFKKDKKTVDELTNAELQAELNGSNLLDQVSLALSNPKTRKSLLEFIQSLEEEVKENVENEISIIGNALQLHSYAKLGSRFLFVSEDKLPAVAGDFGSSEYTALKNAIIAPTFSNADAYNRAIAATENEIITNPNYDFPESDVFLGTLAANLGKSPKKVKTFLTSLGDNFPNDNDFVNKYVTEFGYTTTALLTSINNLSPGSKNDLIGIINDLIRPRNIANLADLTDAELLGILYANRANNRLVEFVNSQAPVSRFRLNFNTFTAEISNIKAPLTFGYTLAKHLPTSIYATLKRAAINLDINLQNAITQTETKIKSNQNRRIARAENPYSIALGKKIEAMGLGRGLPTGSSDADYVKTTEAIATTFPQGSFGITPTNPIEKLGSKLIFPELQTVLLSIKRDEITKTGLLRLINAERRNIAAGGTPPQDLKELPKDDYLTDFLWRNRTQSSVQGVLRSYADRNPTDLAGVNAFNKISAITNADISSLDKAIQLENHYNTIVDEPPKAVDTKGDYVTEKEAVVKRTQRSAEFNVYEEALELNRELQATYIGMWKDIQADKTLTEKERKEKQEPLNRALKELRIDAAGIRSVIEGTGHLIRPGEAGTSPLSSFSNLFGAGIPTSYNNSYTSENGDVWKRSYLVYDPGLGGMVIRTKVQTADGEMEDKITDFIVAGVETDIVKIRENAWKRINVLGTNEGLIRTKVGENLLFCTGRPLGYRSLASCNEILDNPEKFNQRVFLFDIFLAPLLLLSIGVTIPLVIVDFICYLFGLPAAWVAGESKTEMSAAIRETPFHRILRLLTSTPHERVSAIVKSQVEQYLIEKRLSEVTTTDGRKPFTLASHWVDFEKDLTVNSNAANLANKQIADSNKLFNKEVEAYAKELHASSPSSNYDDLLTQARTAVTLAKSGWSQDMIDNLGRRAFPKEAGKPKEAVTAEQKEEKGTYVSPG